MENNKISILVIDNEPISLQQAKKSIHANSSVSEIFEATGPNQAIFKIINSTPDLIVITYPMKGDGEKELFELIKSKLPETTVSFVSENKDHAKTAIQNGVYKYLLKPLTVKKISKLIEETVEKKQYNLELRMNQALNTNLAEEKLKIQTAKGFVFVSTDELIYCKSTGYRTEINLTNRRKEICQLTLTKFEEKMNKYNYIRNSRT